MPTVPTAYTTRAAEYIALLGSMAAVHPSDRALVDAWAAKLHGPVVDAGCGPGHWTAHLAARRLDVQGVDLTPAFIEHARITAPGIQFSVNSIEHLDAPDGSLGGILSWFSAIHHQPDRIAVPLAEFARALRAGGLLLLGFFDGNAVEPFDHAVVRAYRWPASEMRRQLEAVGFEIVSTHRRSEPGRRPVAAIIARRRNPGATPS